MCILIIFLPVFDVKNFEIKLNFLSVFLRDQKSQDKNANMWCFARFGTIRII